MQERTFSAELLTDDEWKQLHEAALEYAREKMALCGEMVLRG
jgi:hypothetical protein